MHQKIRKRLLLLVHGETFYWNVFPFGLKNVGATYQGAITTIFHDMMHKTMEDYVDDTLVKSAKHNTYLQDLGPILDRMEKFSFRLNPKKWHLASHQGNY